MTRHSIDPEDTDGGTVTAAIEKEALRMAEEIPFSDFLGRLSIASHQAEHAEKNAEHYRTLAKKAESKLEDALLRACPDPDAHWRIVEAFERAEKAEEERNDARHEVLALRGDLARAEAINNDVSDEMVERGWASISPTLREALSRHTIRRILETALAPP